MSICSCSRQLLLVLSLLFICGASINAKQLPENRDWQLVDDFERADLLSWQKHDTKNNTSPYIENPQVTEIRQDESGNRYLLKKPAEDGVVGNRKALSFVKLPSAVPVGKTFTFYTRINVEYFPNNHIFGLSDLGPQGIVEHGYNAFEPSLRITDKAESNGFKNDGALMVKLGKGYANINNYTKGKSAEPLKPGQWYEVWYVVNNATLENGGQTYDVYVRGGEFEKQQLVYEGADFRMKREQPLIYFLTNSNTGPVDKPYGNGGVLYDDIYMVEGLVLSKPM